MHTALQTRTVIFFRISLWGLCFTQPFLSIQQGDRVRYLENLPATFKRASKPATPRLLIAAQSPQVTTKPHNRKDERGISLGLGPAFYSALFRGLLFNYLCFVFFLNRQGKSQLS